MRIESHDCRLEIKKSQSADSRKGGQPEKVYEVILVTKQDASGLKQGDKISFDGRISNLRGDILEIVGEFSKGSE